MFINKDMMLSILQLTEFQYEVYKKFLSLTNNETEAEKQTRIFITSMIEANRSQEE
ncbi:MAG: hypothetical protein E6600_04530 [Anaerocolumna aminovalerica]|uniref:hypothetical protein n=1 Tax=Anaerocolumna aminovalerica TaxID=1527 RepID=UPI00290A305B|nr:hypothetical protein [Anaerocolumna aminovalerica]MDU6263748.1 hypothetical protein [Anaerocolumna aminovalerica]